jgi:hypothetical protein
MELMMMMHAEIPFTSPGVATEARLSGDVFGALINLSGRRRFTSQRAVLYAVLASLGHDGAAQTARETLAAFTDAHVVLVEGKQGLPGIFCRQLHDAYFGTLQGDRIIRDFIALAGSTLDAIGTGSPRAPALLDKLVRSATPLLGVLNTLTLVYEEQAKRRAQQQRRQMQDMMADIKTIARQARMIAFNAQIVAARAGPVGNEFAVVASTMTNVTGEIDDLVQTAMSSSLAY